MVNITRRNFLKSVGSAIVTTSLLGLPIRAQDLETLSISLPAQNESVPIAYAEEQGIFNDFGINLQLNAFRELRDRDAALFLGSIDGAVSDLSSILCVIENNTPISITSTAYENIDGARRYTVMTHNFSFIEDMMELLSRTPNSNSQKIGLVRHTDIEYQTDLLVEGLGFSVDEDGMYRDEGDMVQLATLLAAGSQDAAVIPEPIASYVEFITEASGTPVTILSDFSDQVLSPSVVTFQNSVIESNPTLIDNFYRGYRDVINEFATTDRTLIVDAALDAALRFFFPGLDRSQLPPGAEEFLATYVIPEFPQPRELTQDEYNQVDSWAVSKNFLSASIPYSTVYTNQFINS